MYKRKRTVKVDKLSGYEFDGDVSKTIKRLQELQTEHGSEVSLMLSTYTEYDTVHTDYHVMRPETDAECEAREKKDALLAETAKAGRRAAYERLKQEFGE